MSVGYDMYLKLLEDAVLEEQGQEKRKEQECTADLNVSANIPERYVASAEQRMDLYRRIAAIRSREDADDLMDELLDRYGDAPKSVLALLDVALLRAAAAKVGDYGDHTERSPGALCAGRGGSQAAFGRVRYEKIPFPAASGRRCGTGADTGVAAESRCAGRMRRSGGCLAGAS